ncbi:hypothetical protein predicted by Glimmer/Critica [Salmonella enterica subsp. enterica serovar Weltevreden str. 2007-60-3289-1]|nr:hypothetical protein predicted by Glimmer/Critica [Salmonella enterica subsp. enterica serovar Weltevreden str. 2007-60-3289-1]
MDGNENMLGWFTHYHSIRIAGNVAEYRTRQFTL